MEVSDLQRMRELEQENARLKRLYADLSLDHSILKEMLTKNFDAPSSAERRWIGRLRKSRSVSDERAVLHNMILPLNFGHPFKRRVLARTAPG